MIEKEQFTVEGHKDTLLDIRQKLLTKHCKLMRSYNGDDFDSLDKKTLQQRLINAYKFNNEISVEEMQTNLKSCIMTLYFTLMLNTKLYWA